MLKSFSTLCMLLVRIIRVVNRRVARANATCLLNICLEYLKSQHFFTIINFCTCSLHAYPDEPMLFQQINCFHILYCIYRNEKEGGITIYEPMIYTAPCVRFWCGQIAYVGKGGGGWRWKSRVLWAPLKLHEPIGMDRNELGCIGNKEERWLVLKRDDYGQHLVSTVFFMNRSGPLCTLQMAVDF